MMSVELTNDGPVTLMFDSKNKKNAEGSATVDADGKGDD